MGACNFEATASGISMGKAFQAAVEESNEEYGNDSYSGEIATKGSFRDVTEMFKRSKLSLQEFIDKHDSDCDKWGDAWGICLKEPKKNSNKIKTLVEHIISKGTKKWELKYVICNYMGDEIGSKDKKGDAVKAARAHTEKTQRRTYVEMQKVLKDGNSRVATISYKSGKNESDGKYVFFGMAPC